MQSWLERPRRRCGAPAGSAFVLLALVFEASSCCGPPAPPAAKFFERTDPTSTLKGFVYGVDTHQWEFAYECLAESSRKEIGPLKFQVAIRFLPDPVWREVSVFDVISNSLQRRAKPVFDGDRAKIQVTSKVRNSKGQLLIFQGPIFFIKEEGEWRLDLLESVRSLAGPPPPEA